MRRSSVEWVPAVGHWVRPEGTHRVRLLTLAFILWLTCPTVKKCSSLQTTAETAVCTCAEVERLSPCRPEVDVGMRGAWADRKLVLAQLPEGQAAQR